MALLLKKKGFPKEGELVVATVKETFKHGAVVTLDEYEGLEAFVHISEVSLKWVRNISDYLRVGHKTVLKVIRSDPEKMQVDASLRRVSKKEQAEKMMEWSRRVKVSKMLEAVMKETGTTLEVVVSGLIEPALERGREVHELLEEVASGEELPSWVRLPKDFAEKLVERARRELKRPTYVVKAVVKMTSRYGGVERLKRAAEEGMAVADGQVRITLIGSPRYLIRVEAYDKEKAEAILSEVIGRMRSVLSGPGDELKVLEGPGGERG